MYTLRRFNNDEHDRQMAEMRSFEVGEPSIGIFWYDPSKNELFGVNKQEVTPMDIEAADSNGGILNYPRLHKTIWNKEFYRARAHNLDTPFKGDYTQVPRGRIRWNKDHFEVLVGKWHNQYRDELTELIKQEFNLDDFVYVYDEHWDLGHGWSGDRL